VTTALVGAGLALGLVLARRRDGTGYVGRDVGQGSGCRAGRPGSARLAAVLGGLAAGFCLVAAAALIPWGTPMFGPALRAGGLTSIGSPWRWVRSWLHLLIGEHAAEGVVKAGAVVLAAGLLVLLVRYIVDTSEQLPVAGAFVIVFAWLLASPYVLPWYEGLGWALLALLPACRLDWLLLARTTGLAIGYLPARASGIVMPGGLRWLETVVRTAITPAVLLAVVVLTIVWLWPARGPVGWHYR